MKIQCTPINYIPQAKSLTSPVGTQKDRVSFSGSFTKLEKQLMKEVMEYSAKNNVETCRIIKNGKDITDRFELYEYYNLCQAYPASGKVLGVDLGFAGKIFNYRRNMKNATYIHSHNTETPLSRPDLIMAIKSGLRRMSAVTPSGKYSFIDINPKSKKKILESLPLFDKTVEKYNELIEKFGETFLEDNKEALKEYQKFLMNVWSEFSQKTGIKHETNLQI